MLVVLALAALAAGAAALLLLDELARPGSERHDALRRVAAYSPPGRAEKPAPGRLTAPLARLSRRLDPRRSESDVAGLLTSAGLAGRLAVADFLALELVASVALAAAGGVLAARRGAAAALVLAFVLGAAGFLCPRFVLRLRARRRVERIRAGLPDALDLLAVSVSAGLGLDAALARLAETTAGPFAEELALVLTEIRIGEGRRQALERMATRLGAREVTAFVRALVQGEQLGTSLAETLRTQAIDSRRRCRTASEEKASKASVKMIFPTAVFIFPALFVVILAPAILAISEQL